MEKEIQISFLGDVCPVNRVEKEILANNYSGFDSLRGVLSNQDLVIANLECPLTESKKKIKKIGPNLRGHPETVNLLRFLNIGMVALANNHIMDYDEEGLTDTIDLLKKNSIEYTGAGQNETEARRPFIKEVSGLKICIINICEREFNIAGKNKVGANTFNIITLLKDIKEYKEKSDLLILFYHGGVESYNLPSPEMFRNFRFLAEMGIDIIICNHQHVFSGYQKMNGSFIFYGLGNSIFDWPSLRNDPWNYGIVLRLIIKKRKEITFELIPYEQNNNTTGVIIDTGIKETVFRQIEILNSKLNEDSIKQEWTKFVQREHKNLLSELFIQNKYLRYLLKRTGLIKLLVTKDHLMKLYNYFNCQSHSEMLRDSLYRSNR